MKKRIKNILSMAVSLAWLCTMQANIVTVVAAPSLSATADTADLKKGEYVDIQVDLKENPAISTLGASLGYDSSVLKYDSSTWNGSFSGSDMQMASDTGSEVNLSVVCDDNYAEDGTVVTVRFQAVEDSDSIPVTLSLRDMADADLSVVSDCTVASTVRTPAASDNSQSADTAGAAEDIETVDLENLDEGSGVRIVDKEVTDEGESEMVVLDADSNGTKGSSGASASKSQSVLSISGGTQTATSSQAQSSRPDANYKTGDSRVSDLLLVGAAAFGILALILAVRCHGEEQP